MLHVYAVRLQVESHVCVVAGAGIPADVSYLRIVHLMPSIHARTMCTECNLESGGITPKLIIGLSSVVLALGSLRQSVR